MHNKVDKLTPSDRTCLSELVGQYPGNFNLGRCKSLLTKLNLKILDLGAELPPLTKEHSQYLDFEGTWLAPEFARFPDYHESGSHMQKCEKD